ncbi:phosphoglycerate mutase family protein [Citrus sinensis]|uniref:Phosphoglycerate mutase family protein n=1 Tax=Citrus sinensis TaxID=2711 RepID=A0ACB8IBF8_CITSI|nr:phosphoglycerate mutase family protein [Citrus sinensis]KAH9694391.1 phosphoglycerate mutase family protein [Citrus sinensis]
MATTPFLRNKYWVLRHGKSIPNEKGLIVSSLELNENNIPLENVRICYSPFSRTTHTAEVVASVLNLPFEGPQCKVMEDLRERFFGPSFELLSHDKYPEIWALDEKDPFMRPEGGESVNDVVSRLATAMAAMELEFQGCAILVVSHGDPLQILQTLLNAVKQVTEPNCDNLASRIETVRVHNILSQHRKNALLTGELRSVVQ